MSHFYRESLSADTAAVAGSIGKASSIILSIAHRPTGKCQNICHEKLLEKINRWDNASFYANKIVQDYVNSQKDWLTLIHQPTKAPYLNPNERKVNQYIKSDVCENRFFHSYRRTETCSVKILDSRFGTWNNERNYDTS